MTPTQLKDRLNYLGVTQSGFAELVYVHPNTVSKWVTGQAKVPGPVVAYLDLADGVMALTRRLGR
ncbi:helix-turn-helix domain-containing protein [Aureimonas altamirensis]|uniref:helix-turn-helix domain-containing protein n=1 Tax=Aureimonas altamirensis TaxID=370622 RepID=UPI00057FCFF4|nr:transcriptional regulator [Aureimonas altamirensis]